MKTKKRKDKLPDPDTLAHRIIALRDALEPFAEYGRLVDRLVNPVPDDAPCEPLPASLHAHGKLVTVGACREAYRVLWAGK